MTNAIQSMKSLSLKAFDPVPHYNADNVLTGYRVSIFDIGGCDSFATVFDVTPEKASEQAAVIVSAVNSRHVLLAAVERALCAAQLESWVDGKGSAVEQFRDALKVARQ